MIVAYFFLVLTVCPYVASRRVLFLRLRVAACFLAGCVLDADCFGDHGLLVPVFSASSLFSFVLLGSSCSFFSSVLSAPLFFFHRVRPMSSLFPLVSRCRF
ncbi:hypothetical protein [Bifidobacterium bifidum]|uniref:hypothetical protein n=1 Tax=Bifidobacterium bifidum TaxID=1681 RepID=UPI0011C21148|nr:hypothetical protein [Bifidobacterium bifidum]